jgi:hypothetical protein
MPNRFSGVGSVANPMAPPVGGGFAGGGFGGGGASTEPSAIPTLQVFPWWYYPLDASQYIYVDTLDAAGVSQVIPAGAQNVPLLGSELQVNQGEVAVIVAIALVVQVPTAADNYFFTLRRNSGPVEGLRRLRNFSVAANASVREFGGYAVQLSPSDLVDFTCTNNGAAPVTIALNYQGWRSSALAVEKQKNG